MFDRLPASDAPRSRRSGAAVIATAAHGALVTAAILGTTRVAISGPATPHDTVIWFQPAAPRGDPTVPPLVVPSTDPGPVVDAPPIDVGRIDPGATLDPSPGPPGPWPGAPSPFAPVGVLPAALAEEPPELLAGPPLAYPPLLRTAGVQGRVVVEAVVDTAGRAEAQTIRVVESAHPGFAAPAVAFLRGALFRPARVHGRGVRVLVRVPVEFRLR